jgi:hypothetical protein
MVSKEKNKDLSVEFYGKMPFNLCDHWCEHCQAAERCQIFQQSFNLQLTHIIKGEDVNHPMVIMSDLKKTLDGLIRNIKKDFKKQGLNSKDIKLKVVNLNAEYKVEKQNLPLLQLGQKFTIETEKFINDLFFKIDQDDTEFIDNFKEEIESLNWYYIFFEDKIYRAIIDQQIFNKEKKGGFKDLSEKDMNVSAELAFRSLKVCQKCLEIFSQNLSEYKKWINDLSILAKSILEKLETKFPDCHSAQVIFHKKIANN